MIYNFMPPYQRQRMPSSTVILTISELSSNFFSFFFLVLIRTGGESSMYGKITYIPRFSLNAKCTVPGMLTAKPTEAPIIRGRLWSQYRLPRSDDMASRVMNDILKMRLY